MMEIIIQVLAAAVGTIAFSVLFSVPKRYYGFCGICGGAGWLVYALLVPSLSVPVATFFATVLVIFLSRIFAMTEKCPATVFLTTGIFPLVPGVGLYWTTYYTVTEQMDLAQTACWRCSRRWRLCWGLWWCLNCRRGFSEG